ncbi:hypothetical protein J6590_025720 [Homalodisca vitripennis]|nr:hypothetical protein J6590_025720 [Homalodisca vitripennis]
MGSGGSHGPKQPFPRRVRYRDRCGHWLSLAYSAVRMSRWPGYLYGLYLPLVLPVANIDVQSLLSTERRPRETFRDYQLIK